LTVFKDAINKLYADTTNNHHFLFLFTLQFHTLHIARAVVLRYAKFANYLTFSDCFTNAYYISSIGELGAAADRFSAQGGLEILVKYLGWPLEHVNFVEGKSWQQV
jgi:hypothetical protein